MFGFQYAELYHLCLRNLLQNSKSPNVQTSKYIPIIFIQLIPNAQAVYQLITIGISFSISNHFPTIRISQELPKHHNCTNWLASPGGSSSPSGCSNRTQKLGWCTCIAWRPVRTVRWFHSGT